MGSGVCHCVFGCISALVIIMGMGLTIGGVSLLGSAMAHSPSEVFDTFDAPCTISHAFPPSRRNRNGDCYDDYRYQFCTPFAEANSSSCRWRSKQHGVRVCGSGCSRCGRETTPIYSVGDNVTCWRPAPGVIPRYPFHCPNERCYRIVDPALEHESARDAGAVQLPVGFCFLLAGCCAACATHRAHARRIAKIAEQRRAREATVLSGAGDGRALGRQLSLERRASGVEQRRLERPRGSGMQHGVALPPMPAYTATSSSTAAAASSLPDYAHVPSGVPILTPHGTPAAGMPVLASGCTVTGVPVAGVPVFTGTQAGGGQPALPVAHGVVAANVAVAVAVPMTADPPR